MAGCCDGKQKLIYPCSGAADVGEIADRVARKLRTDGYGNMSCLAGVGSHQFAFIESAKAAENFTIDGCQIACAKKTLEHAGIIPRSYILTEIGLIKGKTPVTDEVVTKITAEISKSMPRSPARTGGGCSC